MQHPSQTHSLTLLWYLRWVAIAGQAVAILLVDKAMDIPLPTHTMISILLLQVLLNLLTILRLQSTARVSNNELFVQLLLDTAFLSAQLYCSGGSSNPFTGLFLLQVIIAATVLPPRYTWAEVAITLGCYLLLIPFNIPLPHIFHYHLDGFFNLHLQGMLISYAVSAGLVAFFIVRMSQHLKERDQLIAKQREQAKAQEYLLHLGMLAASAAHELGTPLSTIATLSGEIRADMPALTQDTALSCRLTMLDAQIARCKEALQRLTFSANALRAENTQKLPANIYFQRVIERWQQSAAPSVSYHFSSPYSPHIATDTLLDQAIHNLLDNAANAAASKIDVLATCSPTHITLEITDNGKGIDPHIIEQIGNPITPSEKENAGMGVGLLLCQAVAQRLHGSLTLSAHAHEGTCAILKFPLSSMEVTA